MSLTVRFSSSTAFMSNMIRRACHSRFSHVDIVLPGEGLLGVSGKDDSLGDPGGVRIRPFEPWPYNIIREVTIGTEKSDTIIAAARTQIGKPFDDHALYAFFNPLGDKQRDWRALDQWFCSEMVIWACESSKMFPYKLCVPMNMINPNDTMQFFNPFMSDADVDKLLS